MAGVAPDGIGAAMLGVPVSAGAVVWAGTAGAGTAIIITGHLFTGPQATSLRVTGPLVISPLVTGPPVTDLLVTDPLVTIGRQVDVRAAVIAVAAVAEAGLILGLRNSSASSPSNEGAPGRSMPRQSAIHREPGPSNPAHVQLWRYLRTPVI